MPDDPFGTDAVWNAAEAPEADLGNFVQRKKSLAYKKLEWSDLDANSEAAIAEWNIDHRNETTQNGGK